jgi:hypothetical protein
MDKELGSVAPFLVPYPEVVRAGEHLGDVQLVRLVRRQDAPEERGHRRRVEIDVPGLGLARCVDEHVPRQSMPSAPEA